MKEKLPKKSFFGDDNHAPIDAMIAVLAGKDPEDYYVDETAEEYQDGDNNVYWEADRAKHWMKGEEKDDLFE